MPIAPTATSRTARGTSPNPDIPRTARAFGSLSEALRVRQAIESYPPPLAGPALKLIDADRGRIFRFWNRLTPPEREALLRQVAGLDLDLLERNLALLKSPGVFAERTAGQLSPPVVLEPATDPEVWRALALGEEVLERGWLALVEGAGGTGSRFFKASGDHPKGLFTISPTERHNFFEVRLARLMALRRRYRKPIPYILMVSDATDAETRAFFESRRYFGLEDEILIVRQRSLPYMEEVAPGEYDLLLENPAKVAVGGYGHADFTKHVLLQPNVQAFLSRFGTRYVQWLQIDNPLAIIGHRYLLGAHRRAEPGLDPKALAMSFIALKKEVATEAAGLLVRRGRGLAVWEYSDMDSLSKHLLEDESGAPWLAVERGGASRLIRPEAYQDGDRLLGLPDLAEGQRAGLRYRWEAINPNLVVVSLQSVIDHPEDNPPLAAKKSCTYIDDEGRPGDRSRKFLKFEAFLFDGFNDGVVVAEDRTECFAPTKNAEGPVDSPISARRLMVEHDARRLRAIGWEVSSEPGTLLELDGLVELSPEAMAARIGRDGKLEPGALLSIQGIDLALGDKLTVRSGGALRIEVPGEDPRAPLEVPARVSLPAGTVIDAPLEIPG